MVIKYEEVKNRLKDILCKSITGLISWKILWILHKYLDYKDNKEEINIEYFPLEIKKITNKWIIVVQ